MRKCLRLQWNHCIVATLGPTFYGWIIEGGCIIEVHNTLAICTLGPNKVASIERLAAIERPHYRGSTVLVAIHVVATAAAIVLPPE